MDGLYYFMRKNEPLTMIELNEKGEIEQYSRDFRAPELLPLFNQDDPRGLAGWWKRRSVPVNQEGIAKVLREHGFSDAPEYLAANLGLSLTDYYWIKPVDSDLTWDKVNLFANDFHSDKLTEDPLTPLADDIPHYSPNSSLQGNIEKTWSIINGERCLVKGNRGIASTQSLNEILASTIYRMQDYDNYTEYHLLRIKGKDYDFGCYSKDFASEKMEFIPAYDVVCSVKKPNDTSSYEHFINICEHHGIDKEQLRADLEMQILTDYVISGHDRHLNNLGVLRDADTLKFIRLAPIYDSGEAFFTGRSFPQTEKDWMSVSVTSFCNSEREMMAKVTDPGHLDLSKLPPESFVRNLYLKDTKTAEGVTNAIVECYRKKIDMLSDIQRGKNPYHEFRGKKHRQSAGTDTL